MRFAVLLFSISSLSAAEYSQVVAIFKARCYACHGPGKQASGFRLDDAEAALEGGYGGKAIIPGKSAESNLWLRVAGKPGLIAMPMGSRGLAPEEAALIAAWIDAGAKFPPGLKAAGNEPSPAIGRTSPLRSRRVPSMASFRSGSRKRVSDSHRKLTARPSSAASLSI